MLTQSAQRSLPASLKLARATVVTASELQARRRMSHDAVLAQLDARRWRRFGHVLVLHAGPLQRAEIERVALLNCGPRAVFTAFTATSLAGLRGWDRDEVHVLVPSGARVRRIAEIPTEIHYQGSWSNLRTHRTRRIQDIADALVVAAGSMPSGRSACGILAAGVQQRIVTAARLTDALQRATRVRHRRALVFAVRDIAQGSEALSEIDFVRLCRRYGLPEPARQIVRRDRNGQLGVISTPSGLCEMGVDLS